MFSATWIQDLIQIIQIISVFISILFLFGIIYFTIKRSELREKERERWNAHFLQVNRGDREEERSTDAIEWGAIRDLFHSQEEGDWKLALLRTDAFIEDQLTRAFSLDKNLSYADKLKGLTYGDIPLLDEVWNIHKLRNRLAHEKGDFRMSRREADEMMRSAENILEYLSCDCL